MGSGAFIYCRCEKKLVLFKKVADVEVKGHCHGIIMMGQIYYRLCGFRGDAEAILPQPAQGKESKYSMCFWYVGAVILIWPRLNQKSNLPKLQNYSLGRDSISSELLPDFPPARGYLVFQSSVLSFPPFLSSGRDLCFNSICSAAERPGNYLFLQGNRGAMWSWWRGNRLPSVMVW